MPRPKLKIYSPEDWASADPIERLYIHLLQPTDFPLSYELEEKLIALRGVWAIMCENSRQIVRTRMISALLDVSERTVYRYMEDARYLFGDILMINAELELQLLKERYYALADEAQDAGDIDVAKKCLDSAREILVEQMRNQPKDQAALPPVLWTSDPAALNARNNDAEEIEFTELPAAALLEPEAASVPARPAAG
jgi:hypothetical protein